jgi:hypothetical protein
MRYEDELPVTKVSGLRLEGGMGSVIFNTLDDGQLNVDWACTWTDLVLGGVN